MKTIVSLFNRKKDKDRSAELKCKFCISDNTDELLDTFKNQTGVTIDGILGNDFMTQNGYVIDYKTMTVRHNSLKISIKDAMTVLDLPLIILWQNGIKYIFMLDTGATASLIHSRCLENGLVFEKCDSYQSSLCGLGGIGVSSETVSVTLSYKP